LGVLCSGTLGVLRLIAGVWADKFLQLAGFQNFFILPLSFLSGVFYSIHSLPGMWQTVSQFNPFFYLIDGFRYSFIGTHDSNLLIGALMVVTVNFFLWICSLAVLRSGYKLKA